ncbi:MAG: hypothetical protein ACO1QB_14285, partial [Verrucomicrobiales bacterium]
KLFCTWIQKLNPYTPLMTHHFVLQHCPNCFAQVRSDRIRRHLASKCPKRTALLRFTNQGNSLRLDGGRQHNTSPQFYRPGAKKAGKRIRAYLGDREEAIERHLERLRYKPISMPKESNYIRKTQRTQSTNNNPTTRLNNAGTEVSGKVPGHLKQPKRKKHKKTSGTPWSVSYDNHWSPW